MLLGLRGLTMVKLQKGDRVRVSGKISGVWNDNMVTIHIRGYEHPITLRADFLDEVIPREKEPRVRNRKKPIYDNPDRS
ncbi:hypothetical protein [Rhizobium phage RHph_X2_30]|nr:hypothetical protein [Rhizobium phage RHph_X2_30]